MSKTKAAKPELADWSVTLLPAGTGISAGEVIPRSRWKRTRTERGWGYTFYGEHGVIAEFTPGTVAHVFRVPESRKRCDHSRHAGGHKPSTFGPGACYCGLRGCSICPDVVAGVPPEGDPGPIGTNRG